MFSFLINNFDSVILLLVGVVLVIYGHTASSRKANYRLPKGPKPWPLIGNILALRGLQMHEVFASLAKTHGPVFSFYAGPLLTIVLNNIPSITEAFVDKGREFANRPQFNSLACITYGCKDVAFHEYNEEYMALRRIMVAALKEYLHGKTHLLNVHSTVNQVLDAIEPQTGKPFDMKTHLNRFTYNLLATATFGTQYTMESPELNRLIYTLGRSNATLGVFLFADIWKPLKFFQRKEWEILETSTDILQEEYFCYHLKCHEETFDAGDLRDITDSIINETRLLKASDPEKYSWIDRSHLGMVLLDVIAAGTDTTRESLYWWVLFMATHPHVQDQAFKEIQTEIGDKEPDNNVRKVLPYLEATILEVLRMSPAVPLMLPHRTMCDTTVGGYDVPAQTLVVANTWAVHYDASLWEKPEEYNPQRFVDNRGLVANLLTFGMGKRSCLGQNIAKSEMLIFCAMMLQRFDIKIAPGQTATFKANFSTIAYGSKSYEVVIEKRSK